MDKYIVSAIPTEASCSGGEDEPKSIRLGGITQGVGRSNSMLNAARQVNVRNDDVWFITKHPDTKNKAHKVGCPGRTACTKHAFRQGRLRA